MRRAYYLIVSAVAGAAVLALEVLAARAMAPAIGSGSVSWAVLLAVALGMLAVGNLVGGVLSERLPPDALVAWCLASAANCLVALSQGYAPAMRWSAQQPLLAAAALAAMITQAVPLVLLGLISPAILRQPAAARGPWSGAVLAAGSGGGIVGALVAGIVLLPTVGIARSYLVVAALLAVVALPAALRRRRWLALLLIVGGLAAAAWGWQRADPGPIVQSCFGQIEVDKTETASVLLIDGLPQTGMPADLAPGDGLRYGYLLEMALVLRPRTQNALVVGLGAGLAARLLAAQGIDCESVEIDPQVAEIARKEFGFAGRATVGDGRAFLARTDRRYDLIVLDICTADRLPWHLFTREAMQLVRARLAPAGILAMQFIGDDGPWSASLARTAEVAFGHGQIMILSGSGDFGGVGPRWLFATCGLPPGLPQRFFPADHRIPWRIVEATTEGRLLTDDHFPAELDWARTAHQWRSLYAGR
jgi:hypothetical protein